ncbi:L-aspartate oxidase [Gordonia sp. X0973]|uniref:L-aspartate oxidase n=1 Tax=Gordonia sp. X0973 TaxID=2742602 RepID=UPI000F54BB17|nr:L-aspartate oxidase [Gordonia sp. X0973]QKT08859.1 L-aspartate oxidase [Gordonia sp. X0973]
MAVIAEVPTRADLVIVGAGVAGLTAALRAARGGLSVVVLNKGAGADSGAAERPSSTFYAQGGIAVVLPDNAEDSIGLHVADTLAAGAGLVVPEPTELIVADGWDAVSALIDDGAEFDRDADGRLLRTREGGHSVRRIIHAGGDATGAHVQRSLERATTAAIAEGCDIRCVDHAMATQILQSAEGEVTGVTYLVDDGESTGNGTITAPTVLVATGGAGHLYAATTNPGGATGDGIALALRAGAQVADLEFIQFHPTMLYVPGARGRRSLVSEALRGEGARLVDAEGNSVTEGVHPMGDLAPRDVVARAVEAAIERTGADCAYLDISGMPDFATRFPTVRAGIEAAGVDISDGRIPIVPGAHYLCGGVVTDEHANTTVTGLLAAGEVARTGLHGANRLASNSLLEGLVMGGRAAAEAIRRAAPKPGTSRQTPQDSRVGSVANRGVSSQLSPRRDHSTRARVLPRTELQNLMSHEVALQRDDEGLRATLAALAAAPIRELRGRADYEDAALTLVAAAVTSAALGRTESRGAHHRADHPETDAAQARSVGLRMAGDADDLRFERDGEPVERSLAL